MTETRLVQQAQRGDNDAFSRLIDPCMHSLYRTALRITHHEQDAEDAVQRALLKAYRNVSGFHGGSRFSTWLIRIVMNESLMILRSRRYQEKHTIHDGDAEVSIFANAVDGRHPGLLYADQERLEAVHKAIQGLRSPLRIAIWMYGIKELEIEDTARALNLSKSAVKMRLHHARTELRQSLANL
jgi:RNA polymerase sigma-70 factor, ECF subfamily